MNKEHLVAYLANIITIVNFHGSIGTVGNQFLLNEYAAREKELHGPLEKEQKQ